MYRAECLSWHHMTIKFNERKKRSDLRFIVLIKI